MRAWVEWVTVVALLGCDAPADAPRARPSPALSAPPGESAAPPSSAPDSAPTGSPSGREPAAPDASLTGRWEGSFEAKRSELSLPTGVKDVVRAGDDPKANTGPGKVSLEVEVDGGVKGTYEGALGPGTLSGAVDSPDPTEAGGVTRVRVALLPDNPDGFFGFLVLERGKRGLEGALHASGPDAVRAREALVRLDRRR